MIQPLEQAHAFTVEQVMTREVIGVRRQLEAEGEAGDDGRP